MGEAWREMNENEYGDWIRYDDHLAALRSRAEGVAEQDAIDAKRYRWLRQRPHVMAQFARDGDGVRKGGFHNRTLDEAIDKAVLEAAPTPPGGTKDEG